MKKILPLLLICLCLKVSAQTYMLPIDSLSGKAVYVDVVDTENSKDVLYRNAQTWIANSFGDYKSVVKLENKESGRIILQAIYDRTEKYGGKDYVDYTMTIDCREKKYRAVIDELKNRVVLGGGTIDFKVDNRMVTPGDSTGKTPKEIKEDEESIGRFKPKNEDLNRVMYGLLDSLRQSMKKKDDF
jgi:hypothetical protein